MRRLWILLLSWAWICPASFAQDQDEWRPAAHPATAMTTPPARLSRPKLRLGAPQSVNVPLQPGGESAPANQEIFLDQLGVFQRDPLVQQTYYRGQTPDGRPFRTTGGYGGGQIMGGPEEPYNCGVVSEGPPAGGGFFAPVRNCWDRLFGGSPNCGPSGTGGGLFGNLFTFSFQSDHAFDDFISPMTNPFFFEDPRSLTDVRLLFAYQKSPSDNPLMRGGNSFLYTLQGRLALNENFSIVVHRLGFATVNPGGAAIPGAPLPLGFEGGTALADLALGPKWTFYRNTQSQTIAALGANFEIPIGSEKVLNGNGAAVTPYLSVAQGLGDFHLMGTAGYRFGFSGDRSDHLFASLHLDYMFRTPIGAFYPLVELNYYHYTKNGSRFGANYEGMDAFNLGASDIKGKNLLTLGTGLRYKFSEAVQAGVVYEFPLTGKSNGLMDYRIGVDLIFRF